MSLRIDGVEYSTDTVRQSALGDLFALKAYTLQKGCGVSIKTINATFRRVGAEAQAAAEALRIREDAGLPPDPEAEFDTLDLLDDQEFIANLIGIVYLSKRGAGEKITLDEAWATKFNSVEFVDDDAEEEPEPDDPKGSTGPVELTAEPTSTTPS